ncbi:Tail fiber protein [Burkholderia aenigmatica]|uniref:phage tail protein n=1 Tax=Burkholderia cepacia complex TaxID=87882 RepID=UPI000F07E13B|nr:MULTISPECIES: phage tail protein [Burkholderia cepacia complex]AYQ37133.1 phage tail protein [Burkholderia lata]VWC57801.1 Tail fiber protein [Burkholderia aenigmatica]
MSAPENSNSKSPPSLLSDTKPAGDGRAQQSRILANLEGRVTPPAEPPRRSLKAPIAAVVALVVAVGGWGAWRVQHSAEQAPIVTAEGAPAAAAPAKAAVASDAAVQVAQNAASAASAVQPATIVNDDAASRTVASASSASAADNSRLSRALANGADDASGAATAGAAAAAAAAATTKAAKADTAKGAKVAARGKADAKTDTKVDAKADARKHHKEQQAELAQAKKHRDATPTRTGKAGGKDDPDADLLAALVARTKPADKKLAAQKMQAVPTKTAATTGSLASRVKECSERGFFEDQLCRWRVCEGHWGKDPACPSAAQSETRQ